MTEPTADPARRNERSHRAILRAATEEIAERGYDQVSIESIARRAGVGKQTIYRWWPSKAAVALEALGVAFASEVGFPDTGDIVRDLRTEMRAMYQVLAATDAGPLHLALIAAGISDPTVLRAHIERIIEPGSLACRERLASARDLGQIRDDVDLQTVVDLLYGALLCRMLLGTRPLTAQQIDADLDIVFNGLRPRETSTQHPPRARTNSSSAASRKRTSRAARR